MAFVNRVCDKVFVINLEKDKERLTTFDTIMKSNGIQYNKYNAVDGSKIQRDERLSDYCNTFCTNGMKGCALSHRSLWEIMIEKGYKNMLVFEDDAIIDPNFDRDFNHVWNHLPDNYDIIYFGCVFGCSDTSVGNSVFKKLAGYDTENVNEFIQTTKGSVGTHCYMISLEGAKKFIDKPINFHIDTQIMYWVKTYSYNAYSTNINMVETSKENSSLSDTYPILVNSVLKLIPLNNLKIPFTVDWAVGENFLKLGFFDINLLLILFMLAVCFVPKKYFRFVFLWLLLEFFVSQDFKNTIKYMLFLGIPMGLKYMYV